MGIAEEPLLYAIVRAHHDPDPVRALRYRPFVYATSGASTGPASAPAQSSPAGHAADALRSLLLRATAVGREAIRLRPRPAQPLGESAPACC